MVNQDTRTCHNCGASFTNTLSRFHENGGSMLVHLTGGSDDSSENGGNTDR